MSEDLELTEVHLKVFDFVDGVESAEDQGVPVGLVLTELDLDSVPGFQQDVVLEDAFFDLVDEGYFSMPSFGVARVDSYPQ